MQSSLIRSRSEQDLVLHVLILAHVLRWSWRGLCALVMVRVMQCDVVGRTHLDSCPCWSERATSTLFVFNDGVSQIARPSTG